ncbi:amidoligase family protein [Hydrocarboniclastica marina]|uniref:Alpha-L-fucosidase n=1 Tax=Hydrocarboniclastica marina TaxID=2259620 RepID=A0A4P7XD86_9ALTE|nr:amidoligase family protein [Hydrocarboniclastica marina]MAL97782.1 hypothetical protein [Alteromonadaceae bacterium]QCF24756.1 hypothetical protein soil367_01605 [Hydrocarboniclastica marina]
MAGARCEMPPVVNTHDGNERRVGVEIELSGFSYARFLEIIGEHFDRPVKETGRYVSEVETELGPFGLELDADSIKHLDEDMDDLPDILQQFRGDAMGLIDSAAEKIVPLEIISPPIPVSRLDEIEALCDYLHQAGAKGSRHAILYAFGLQLNPELPDLEADTIRRYLLAFALLYPWIKSRHQLDISRRFTPYIDAWPASYVARLTAADYRPDLDTLIADYIHFNPTRNRAMDLMPLFAHLRPDVIRREIKDDRIKARPTLHYRLPDCDIDNPEWHFSSVWNDWVAVEKLACNPAVLEQCCTAYRDSQRFTLDNILRDWISESESWVFRAGTHE